MLLIYCVLQHVEFLLTLLKYFHIHYQYLKILYSSKLHMFIDLLYSQVDDIIQTLTLQVTIIVISVLFNLFLYFFLDEQANFQCKDIRLIIHSSQFFLQPLDVLLCILNPFEMDDLMFYSNSIVCNYLCEFHSIIILQFI